MGGTEHPGQNPPAWNGLSLLAWEFYRENATTFVREYGLMESRIRALGLDERTEELFVSMMNYLHVRHLTDRRKTDG